MRSQLVLVALLAFLCHFSLDAAAKPKKKPKPKPKPKAAAAAAQNPFLRNTFGAAYGKAKLSRTQETRLVQLVQQYGPKMKQVMNDLHAVYDAEQRDLIERARTMAIRAGVKPENVETRVEEARRGIQFTAEQKQALAKAQAKKKSLTAEIRKKASAFLQPNQLQILFGSPNGAGGNQAKKRPRREHDPI